MPRCRLIAIDIDGTLVNSRDEVTPATRDALVRARRAGIRVVLATGRRYSRALPLVEPLGLDLPLITASGALIKHPLGHRTLFQASFPSDVLRKLLRLVAGRGYEIVAYADTFGDGFDFYHSGSGMDQAELLDFLQLNPNCARIWPALMTNPPPGIFAAFAIGPREEMLLLRDELEQHLPGGLSLHVLRTARYAGYMCEIAPAGVSKWSGILQLADSLDIPAESICAVGDDVNDIPMIVGAGLGVAMGNALDEVKAVADRIAPGHDADGLAEVVNWLISS